MNQLAAAIVAEASGDALARVDDGKDPAAVALGRLGRGEGRHSSNERMTPEERSKSRPGAMEAITRFGMDLSRHARRDLRRSYYG